MIREFGFVNGIENYSRYFDGRRPGQAPFTLVDYFEENVKRFKHKSFLTVIDESHMSIPQVRGMYNGDQARKRNLIEYGFRLPSALDNRPLQFPEFADKTQQRIYVSATPNDWEIEQSGGPTKIVEQLVRPTGLIDPLIKLRPIKNQIENLIIEIVNRINKKQRVLVTTLTKKMAEALTDYLNDKDKIKTLVKKFLDNSELTEQKEYDYLPIEDMSIGPVEEQYYSNTQIYSDQLDANSLQYPKVAYLHSDVETLDRLDILDDLRKGKYDVLVGINLLREGLDLPEVTLVAILDADKEGFLRSRTSLIQTMGRAARHSDGQTILYADRITKSIKAAVEETQRRRRIQEEFNQKYGITPQTIVKPIREKLIDREEDDQIDKYGRRGKGKAGKNKPQKPIIIQLNKKESLDINNLDPDSLAPADKKQLTKKLTRAMREAAKDLDFELATIIRDKIEDLTE